MKVMAKKKSDEAQVERFKEAARMLGCEEDEAAFAARLKKNRQRTGRQRSR